MSATTFIRQGGDLKFVFDRDGEDISGFICLIEVKQFPDDVALISRIIQPFENTWPGILTSTETKLLGDGVLYWLIAKITNATTGEQRQLPERFQVTVSHKRGDPIISGPFLLITATNDRILITGTVDRILIEVPLSTG